jgi:hypothetical protein
LAFNLGFWLAYFGFKIWLRVLGLGLLIWSFWAFKWGLLVWGFFLKGFWLWAFGLELLG